MSKLKSLKNLKGVKNKRQREPLPRFPEKGAFIMWKKVNSTKGHSRIIALLVPAEAARVFPQGHSADHHELTRRKFRVEKAKVLYAEDTYGYRVDEGTFLSQRTTRFKYKIGQWVKVRLCKDVHRDCAPGIYGLIEKEDARRWN